MTKQRRRIEAVWAAELRASWSSGTGELRAVSSSARKFELSAGVCTGTSERVGTEGPPGAELRVFGIGELWASGPNELRVSERISELRENV
ncbi:hypothetical protein CRG98_039263 [Punica granatum]|uniref:Uncharacterized protein n=1 Tax=Punica granatum TaxID=22663 RepID=A0A2I0IAF7_PUNGR|nr:hypothetical protein CRG98_039263 [Punica granatum]